MRFRVFEMHFRVFRMHVRVFRMYFRVFKMLCPAMLAAEHAMLCLLCCSNAVHTRCSVLIMSMPLLSSLSWGPPSP